MLIRLNRRRTQKRAQSTGEYAILIGLVIAAVIGMQLYIKRGLMSKSRAVVEHLVTKGGTETVPLTADMQYEPYYMDEASNVFRSGGSKAITQSEVLPGQRTTDYTDYESAREVDSYSTYGAVESDGE